MTLLRPFRNGDPPALAGLWNRGLPAVGVARPLKPHEFDALVVDKPHFDPAGLIVALDAAGRPAGFVHAGFGPEDPCGPGRGDSTGMGAVLQLVVDPDRVDDRVEDALFLAAERYLRSRGAAVIYAGGQYPLNPFYWGIYGGSEWAGVLSSHMSFHRAAHRLGYEPASATVLLEADLAAADSRDPKAAILRRQVRLDVEEDATPPCWWDAAALGPFRVAAYRLLARSDDDEVARALTWDMETFGRLDGRARLGMILLEVRADRRRKGFGRHLVREILRAARDQMVGIVSVQTRSANAAALALYESVGFRRVETATLYRLPAPLLARADAPAESPGD